MLQATHYNTSSLGIVKTELLTSFQSAEQIFHSILEESTVGDLSSLRDLLDQTRGTLKLLQLEGVDMVAEQMAFFIDEICTGSSSLDDVATTALGRGFMVLPRYLDYVLQCHQQCPFLLQDTINELLFARKKAPLLESYFYKNQLPDITSACMIKDGDDKAFRRFKHLFQAGLLGILKSPTSETAYTLMLRGLERISDMLLDQVSYPVLLAAVVESFRDGGLQLTTARKRLLATAERALKLNFSPSTSLCNELHFLLFASCSQGPSLTRAKKKFAVDSAGFDIQISAERSRLLGPAHEALAAMSGPLRDEIHSIKEILEVASAGETPPHDINDTLRKSLQRVADVLAMVEMPEQSDALRLHIKELEELSDKTNTPIQLVDRIASSLLFVESSITSLASYLPIPQSGADHDTVVAMTELQQAEHIVVIECLTGLGVAKRAISAYVDSNFDPIHMANVSVTLNSVRGGMEVLGIHRAASVLKSCVSFINAKMQRSVAPVTQRQWLDTLADALISVEYYIDELQSNRNADTTVLKVAEESVDALGFPST